jgi:hypothetical protein
MTDQQITDLIEVAMRSRWRDLYGQSFDKESTDELRSLHEELTRRWAQTSIDQGSDNHRPSNKVVRIHELRAVVGRELEARKSRKPWGTLTKEEKQRRRSRVANKYTASATNNKNNPESQKAYYEANKEHLLARHQLTRYGLTPKELLALQQTQDSRCAICKTPFAATGPYGRHIDHEHVIGGKVRGLLCRGCNSGIGHFKDNPELLRAAAAYLERSRSVCPPVPTLEPHP